MSLTAVNALVSIQDGATPPVNLAPGDVGFFTPGNTLVFALQNTRGIQRAEMTLLCPGYPGLHQLTYSWSPGQYNGWQITFPESTLVNDASVIAGISLTVTVTDSSSSSITAQNFLESNGIGVGGVILAPVDYAAAKGDILVTASNASNVQMLTKWTQATADAGLMPTGIALTAAVLGFVVLGLPGTEVAASVLGISPAVGAATWGIADFTTAKVLRKNAPRSRDVVMGSINTQGNLLIAPWRPATDWVRPSMPPYNARGNLTADCSTAFRAASADAFVPIGESQLNQSSRVVHLDGSSYLLNKPVHIKVPGQQWEGDADGSTYVRALGFAGPAFYVGPDSGQFPVQANAFAGGNAAIFIHAANAVNQHYLSLRDYGSGVDVNGKTAFEIEMWVAVDASTGSTGSQIMFSSYGERLMTDPTGFAFGVSWTGTGGTVSTNAIYFTLTTTVRTQVVCTPNNSFLKDGTYHKVDCSWDGATMRVLIDGVVQTLFFPSGNATIGGTILQQWWETSFIGAGAFEFWGANRLFQGPNYHLASLRMSDIARHTTGYVPVVAKMGEDSNTMFLINFELFDGNFVIARSRGAKLGTVLVDTYLPHHFDSVAVDSMALCGLRDMSISNQYGPAIDCNRAYQFRGVNLRLESVKCGINLNQNSFEATLSELTIIANGENPRAGISLINAANSIAINNIRAVTGFRVGLVNQFGGDFAVTGAFFSTACAVHVWLGSCYSLNWTAASAWDDEGSTIAGILPEVFCILQGVGNAIFDGIQITESEGTSALIAVQSDGPQGNLQHQWRAAGLVPLAGSPGIFAISGTAPLGTIELSNCNIGPAAPILTPSSAAGTLLISSPQVINGSVTIAAPDSNFTVTRDQHLNKVMNFTGTLTATRTVSLPAINVGARTVINNTNQTLTFKNAGGAVTFNVLAAAAALFESTGAELVHPT